MRFIATIATLLLLSACSEDPLYHKTVETDVPGWTYRDSIDYSVMIEDTSTVHDMHLTIEHSDEYDYQNIYLKIFTAFPDRPRKEERLSINLADKTGQWIGKCSDTKCRIKVYLLENFRFPVPGEYHFIFSQETRNDSLPGIHSLTLELFRARAEQE